MLDNFCLKMVFLVCLFFVLGGFVRVCVCGFLLVLVVVVFYFTLDGEFGWV